MVLITHRTSVLRAVDKLMLLRDGQIGAYGPRDDVLKALSANAQQVAQAKAAPAANNAIESGKSEEPGAQSSEGQNGSH